MKSNIFYEVVRMADILENNNSISENEINFHRKTNLTERITDLESIIAQSEYNIITVC